MKTYIGLNYIQFEDVLRTTWAPLMSAFKRSDISEMSMFIYLMKLRTGQTFSQMAPLFNLSKVTIGLRVRIVRDIMHANFVPLHLYKRKREEITQNTTLLSRQLYGVGENTAITVWDATYVFTIKSSNYDFQKKSYSLQHERNLLKFMLCVATNGYIIAVYGPFEARTNDANILNKIMNEPGNIFEEFRNGDVFVVDRGFRDVIQALKAKGFVVIHPTFATGDQMSRTDANKSRLATKTRFVVEARNSHIKNTWKHLNGTKIYQFIPRLKKDFEIAASLVNAFSSKIVSDKNDWQEIVDSMKARSNQQCQLPNIIKNIQSSSYTVVQNLTLYPKFSYHELKIICHGSYQIRQAPSYYQSHLKENNGNFVIKLCNNDNRLNKILTQNTSNPILLMLDLKSRFRSNKTHKVHVLLSSDLNNKYKVNEYCCTCKHGRRTVGCCSHVLLLIWATLYIDQNEIKLPSKNLDSVFDKWDEVSVSVSDSDLSELSSEEIDADSD